MADYQYRDLTDCTQFRQTLQAKPPFVIHGTVLLIVGLLIAAVVWAARTEADLVVRAPGRVRPMVRVERLADSAAEESQISPSRDGRVVKIHVREGDKVRKGQILVELDTERLRNDIARHQRTIQAAETELTNLATTKSLLAKRLASETRKANAELKQAEQELIVAEKRRTAEIQQHSVTLAAAKATLSRIEKAYQQNAVTASQLEEAGTNVKAAAALVKKASLPVDAGKRNVLRQAVDVLRKEYDVEASKLTTQQQIKREKLQAAKLELANVELELRQSSLTAPIDGTVTSLKTRVGEIANKGQNILELVELNGYRMDLTVSNDDVGHLQVGMPVRIKLDAYDHQKYGTLEGEIVFISPDSQLPKQGTATGPRYIVKVKLHSSRLQRGEHTGRVRLGMTGNAEIITDRENLLSLLLRSLRRGISLG